MAKQTPKTAMQNFREKTEGAMAQIKNLDSFRETDKMVDYVFRVGHELFERPLDQCDEGYLMRTGGKLTGAYAYLGQMASFARAERDVYEQKAIEVEKELMLKSYTKTSKITHAKAEAVVEMGELKDLVIMKEAEKNNWENVREACSTMIMFIQSAMRVKENERYQSKQMHDNG